MGKKQDLKTSCLEQKSNEEQISGRSKVASESKSMSINTRVLGPCTL